ncbi:MAG TPA: hypothetical protein VFP13_08030, partial [Actinomycetota bacterium]|nr:hypothetical protein [Actinomycetota bacterium]
PRPGPDAGRTAPAGEAVPAPAPGSTPTASEPLPANEIREISRSLGRSLSELRRAKEEVQRSFRIDRAGSTRSAPSKPGPVPRPEQPGVGSGTPLPPGAPPSAQDGDMPKPEPGPLAEDRPPATDATSD